MDIDFANALEPVHTTGTIELPAREDSRLRTMARPYFQVRSFGTLSHGFPLDMVLSADQSSFTYTGEHGCYERLVYMSEYWFAP